LTSFITDFNDTNARGNINIGVGFSFKVGSSPLVVTALGRPIAGGAMNQDHTIRIWQDGVTTAPIAMATVTPDSLTDTVYTWSVKYAMLATPITLAADTVYHIVSREYAGTTSDLWLDSAPINDYQTDWATVRAYSLCNAFGGGDPDAYPDLFDTNYSHRTAYGYPTFYTGAPSVVTPEPGSMMVLGMAAVGIMTRLRRRSK
jgi:hypothetical protein